MIESRSVRIGDKVSRRRYGLQTTVSLMFPCFVAIGGDGIDPCPRQNGQRRRGGRNRKAPRESTHKVMARTEAGVGEQHASPSAHNRSHSEYGSLSANEDADPLVSVIQSKADSGLVAHGRSGREPERTCNRNTPVYRRRG